MKRGNLKSCKSLEFLKKESKQMLSPKAIFIISFFFKGILRLETENKFSPRQYQERNPSHCLLARRFEPRKVK